MTPIIVIDDNANQVLVVEAREEFHHLFAFVS